MLRREEENKGEQNRGEGLAEDSKRGECEITSSGSGERKRGTLVEEVIGKVKVEIA